MESLLVPSTRHSAGRAALLALFLVVAGGLAACGDEGRDQATTPGTDPPAADARRPDVIVVVLDTTRADRCSFLGYERPTTPFLEELAREGVAYRECWTPAPWTGPSHASLFTGLRPENHGYLRGNRTFLDETAVTLAERLSSAGYATLGVSNNPNVSRSNGLSQGFDRWEELWGTQASPVVGVDGVESLPDHIDTPEYPSAVAGHELAADWVRERRAAGEPFFVFVCDMEPHLPYVPDADLQAAFVGEGRDAEAVSWGRLFRYPVFLGHCLGAYEIAAERIAVLSDLYDAEIATLDRHLRTFIGGLRDEGLLDDAVLVFVADHGENLGEHGLLDHVLSVHRTLLHVPLLIHAPGRMEADVVEDLVRLEDVAPTLLELCGLTAIDDADGRSLLRDLPGRVSFAAMDRMSDYHVREARRLFPGVNIAPMMIGLRSFTDGRVHYIRARNGDEQLYDLVADPLETRNLVDEDATRLAEARARLDAVHPLRKR